MSKKWSYNWNWPAHWDWADRLRGIGWDAARSGSKGRHERFDKHRHESRLGCPYKKQVNQRGGKDHPRTKAASNWAKKAAADAIKYIGKLFKRWFTKKDHAKRQGWTGLGK